jgi:hypothetical protein
MSSKVDSRLRANLHTKCTLVNCCFAENLGAEENAFTVDFILLYKYTVLLMNVKDFVAFHSAGVNQTRLKNCKLFARLMVHCGQGRPLLLTGRRMAASERVSMHLMKSAWALQPIPRNFVGNECSSLLYSVSLQNTTAYPINIGRVGT